MLILLCQDKTIIAEPLPNGMPRIEKLAILEKKNFILKSWKNFIDQELNLAHRGIYDPLKKKKNIDEILDI